MKGKCIHGLINVYDAKSWQGDIIALGLLHLTAPKEYPMLSISGALLHNLRDCCIYVFTETWLCFE